MDIHKPKPWHGWREFLKEYAIIVVGVLTALGAEQIVVAVDRHEQVEQARAALRREVRHDLTYAVLGLRNDACYGKVLLLWEGYATGGPKPERQQGNFSSLASTTWDIAKTGAVANMPLDVRVAFANFYADVANQMTLIEAQREFSRRLAGYARLPKLTPQEADDFLRELPGMEGLLRAKIHNYANLIETGRRLGETPEAPKPDFTDQVDRLCAVAATVKEAAQP
jgi:hypothetical protein